MTSPSTSSGTAQPPELVEGEGSYENAIFESNLVSGFKDFQDKIKVKFQMSSGWFGFNPENLVNPGNPDSDCFYLENPGNPGNLDSDKMDIKKAPWL
jgi:hypothetical protein